MSEQVDEVPQSATVPHGAPRLRRRSRPAADGRASEQVRVFGYGSGTAGRWVTAALVVVGLAWLFGPLAVPGGAQSAAGLTQEAPYVAGLTVVLLGLLGVAVWVDANREFPPLAVAFLAILATVAMRSSLNINLGVEFNYIVPLIVGLGAGGPLGFFVGAVSCLGSQFWLDQIGTALPGQLFVWGLAGLLGGACRFVAGRYGWLLAPVVGLAFGILAGLLLNLTGWPTTTNASPGFIPVAPFTTNLASLWEYSRATSLGPDLLRGAVTAAGLVVLGRPLSSAIRRYLSPPAGRPVAVIEPDIEPETLERLARSGRVSRLWKAQDHE